MAIEVDDLVELDLFEKVSPEALEILIEGSRTRSLSADEVLFEQDSESSESFFVVLSGEIAIRKLMRTEKSTVSNLEKGDFFGELALFTGDVRRAEAAALTKSTVLEIPRAALRHLKDQHPESLINLYEKMFETLGKRFNTLAQKAEKTQFWL